MFISLYQCFYHCFFPALAGLFAFIFDTSQMIVRFYRQTCGLSHSPATWWDM